VHKVGQQGQQQRQGTGDRTVRVAMIGAGGMSNRVHYPSLASFADVEIVAVCDLDLTRLEDTADRYGVTGRYTNYRQMVEETQPDVVYAVGPPQYMYDVWVWCLGRGLNLFVEKPLGVTIHQAHALMHHYYVVTSTQTGDCQVFDITGERLLDERVDGVSVSRATLDLDRAVYHHNFNLDKRDQLLREHDGDVVEETFYPREHWFVLKSNREGVSARDLARQYGLEELRDYKARSQRQIDDIRASHA
jgi:hypothetical protein